MLLRLYKRDPPLAVYRELLQYWCKACAFNNFTWLLSNIFYILRYAVKNALWCQLWLITKAIYYGLNYNDHVVHFKAPSRS